MQLEAHPTDHGVLWTNPEWDQTKPGTFAVVIGVSKYDHLAGDDQSYGLGQLYVSALTAYRFFSWLKDEYHHPELPLAKVWLLLSPTLAETQMMQGLQTDGFRPASFNHCEIAIGEWFESIQALDSMVSEKSRTLFFFSGHGLEVTRDKQILLPSDYLSPPVRNVNKALSTYNLYTGMGATPVPEHFFFLDACRNDHAKLRELSLEGTPVLNPCPSWRTRPDVISPIVYATGPGASAWAPLNPQQGISVFGRALVECLECVEGVHAWYDNKRYWVTFRGLEDYLDPRVRELLQGAGLRIKQPVQISVAAGKTPICEVVKPAISRGISEMAPPSGPYLAEVFLDIAPKPLETMLALAPLPLPPGWRGPDDSGGHLYNIIKNEFMTKLLSEAKVYNLTGHFSADIQTVVAENDLIFREIARTDDRHTYTIEVELRSGDQVLEFTDEVNHQKVAAVLIRDVGSYPRYTLRFDFMEKPSQELFIAGLDVSLANSNEGVMQEAAKLWNRYRGNDISKDGTPAEFGLLERLLFGKCESPLAATVAALLLLRSRRFDLMHDWLGNLANWFPDRPDGWVIWVEQLLRAKQDEGLDLAINGFLNLEHLDLPLTAEALGHAARQVGELLAFAFPPSESWTEDQLKKHKALKRLQVRLNRALAMLRPGGFCAVFFGPKEAISPDLLLQT